MYYNLAFNQNRQVSTFIVVKIYVICIYVIIIYMLYIPLYNVCEIDEISIEV